MTNRERMLAVLEGKPYDRIPVMNMGYWKETLMAWHGAGHLSPKDYGMDALPSHPDGYEELVAYRGEMRPVWYVGKQVVDERMGFEVNWMCAYHPATDLFPSFETKVLERLPNGHVKMQNAEGLLIVEMSGSTSIHGHAGTLMTGRDAWEELYLPKLQFSPDRVDMEAIEKIKRGEHPDMAVGLYAGSLFGTVRNWMGIEEVSYLFADDPGLFAEILQTRGELMYRVMEFVLQTGVKFDFIHYWEDICFKNGPLISPKIFEQILGPLYQRINDLARQFGIRLVSVDSDGMVDHLLPTWFGHGVNVIFPIEVGTWGGSLEPWRRQYGPGLRGVGGMDKRVLSQDRAAIDREMERLRRLVDMGGFLPCPDHLITPDARWENLQYYVGEHRKYFG